MIYIAGKTYEDFHCLEYKCTGVATFGYSKMESVASRFELIK